MPICTAGETLTLPVQVQILKAFAFQERVYYIARPLKSLANTLWVLSIDGEPLEVSGDLLSRAYEVIGRI